MPVRYISDGSGRDYYVAHTDGGFSNPSKPQDPRITFKQHLRDYAVDAEYLNRRNFNLKHLNCGRVQPKKTPKIVKENRHTSSFVLTDRKKKPQYLPDEKHVSSYQAAVGIHAEANSRTKALRNAHEKCHTTPAAMDLNDRLKEVAEQKKKIMATIEHFAPDYLQSK